MRLTSRLPVLLALVIFGAAVLVGCSSGDDSGSTASGESENAAVGGSAESDAYCGEVESLRSDFSSLEDVQNVPATDALRSAAERANGIVDLAPDDAQADWEQLAGSMNQMLRIIESVGVDLNDPKAVRNLRPRQITKLQGLATVSEELEPASDRIQEQLEAECGFSLSE